jgi:hypothetical protein
MSTSIDFKKNEFLVNDLKEQIQKKDVVIFVGAGITLAATENNEFASWKGLLSDGIHRCELVVHDLPSGWAERVRADLQSNDIDDLLSVAQKVEGKLKRTSGEYGRWLDETVGSLKAKDSSIVKTLDSINAPIITTNYDTIIEQVTSKPGYTWKEKSHVEQVLHGGKPGVIHLHGLYSDPSSVILGHQSYDTILSDEYSQIIMKSLRTMRTLLFVGYGEGLHDPNFRSLFEWTRTVFGETHYRHFRLARAMDVRKIQAEHTSE